MNNADRVYEFPIFQAVRRMYWIDEKSNKILPVNLEKIMYEKQESTWFSSLDRNVDYLKNIIQTLGLNPEHKDFNPYKHLLGMGEKEINEIVQNNVDTTPLTLLRILYPLFRKLVVDLLVESGLVEDSGEMWTIINTYAPIVGKGFPKRMSNAKQEEYIIYFTYYIVMLNNFEDMFGLEMSKKIEYIVDNTEILPTTKIVIPKEFGRRVMYVASSEDVYLISKNSSLFGLTEDEESLNEIEVILRKLEEEFTNELNVLENSKLRKPIIEGYILRSLVRGNKGSSVNEISIQSVFKKMKKQSKKSEQFKIGDKLIDRFVDERNRGVSKSDLRILLENLLSSWWTKYQEDKLISVPVALKNIKQFNKDYRVKGVEVDNTQLVSYDILRVTIKNLGTGPVQFNQAVKELERALKFKSKESQWMENIALSPFVGRDLIKVLDVSVSP